MTDFRTEKGPLGGDFKASNSDLTLHIQEERCVCVHVIN
jgi:hypothetical protein